MLTGIWKITMCCFNKKGKHFSLSIILGLLFFNASAQNNASHSTGREVYIEKQGDFVIYKDEADAIRKSENDNYLRQSGLTEEIIINKGRVINENHCSGKPSNPEEKKVSVNVSDPAIRKE